MEHNIVVWENMPTMRLMINGLLSSSSRTKNIKARYYFIKEKVNECEVEIKYCPTDQMWSEVLNKPKKGNPFKKYRSMLMNVPVEYDDEVEFWNTHPDLLPEEDKIVLGTMGINRSQIPIRSVMVDLSNGATPGILRNSKRSGNIKKDVTWAEVTGGKFQGNKM